jgi:hypothetical protein
LHQNQFVSQKGAVAMSRALERNQALLVVAGFPEAGVDPNVLHTLRVQLHRNREMCNRRMNKATSNGRK